MLTGGVGAANAQAQSSNTSRADLGKKDIFLKLLVAQMQNQDPLKPQDATQMSSQLAQFNMVENQRATNDVLRSMLAMQAILTNEGTAANYLGHEVAYGADKITHTGGSTNLLVNMGADSASTEIVIKDDAGNVVRHISAGALSQGKNFVSWDGLDDQGNQVPNGDYSMEITATDAAGDAIESVSVSPLGFVSAISSTGNGVFLMINGKEVSLDAINYIKA